MQPITRDDYRTVKEAGGKVTFRPLRRNLLRCNQLPHLGRLTCKQAESVRRVLAPSGNGTTAKPRKAAPVEPPLPEAIVDRHGWAVCPVCKRETYLGTLNRGRRHCTQCGQSIMVK